MRNFDTDPIDSTLSDPWRGGRLDVSLLQIVVRVDRYDFSVSLY